MKKFGVIVEQTISTVRYVEAEDEDQAVDEVMEEGFPGVMFLDNSYPEEDGWEPVSVWEVTS